MGITSLSSLALTTWHLAKQEAGPDPGQQQQRHENKSFLETAELLFLWDKAELIMVRFEMLKPNPGSCCTEELPGTRKAQL